MAGGNQVNCSLGKMEDAFQIGSAKKSQESGLLSITILLLQP